MERHDIAVYAGYLNNNAEILTCSSGGIATALSRKMIQEGGYVAGVAYSEDYYSACYQITDDLEKLNRFKGSKYVDVEKGTVYQDIKSLLKSGKKVLFFGTPCIVSAIRAFLKEDSSNLITCEMVCEGPTSKDVHDQYIRFLESKNKSKVVDFSVRHKKDAWMPKYLYAKFENGTVFEKEFRRTEYGFAFKVKGKTACYKCRFKGDARTGDIMLGDYWGIKETDPFWNKNGVSVIFAHTEKGLRFLQSTDGICLFPSDYEHAVSGNPMVVRSREIRPEKEKFEKLYAKKGLIYAARHARTLDRKGKDFILDLLKR